MLNKHWTHECKGKRRYLNKGQAEAAMRALIKQGMATCETVNAYPCGHGAHWHIGHKPTNRRLVEQV